MKKKLKLNDLKVTSFITELDKKDKNVIMGASGYPCGEPSTGCTPPIYPSINRDCAITRVNQQCVLSV
jgi:hypothetical protein